jgi:hypothetical protein
VRVAGPWRQPSFALDFGSAGASRGQRTEAGVDPAVASAGERHRAELAK